MDYNNYNPMDAAFQAPQADSVSRVSAVMKRVYLLMTIGLLITAFTSYGCASSSSFITFFMNNSWMTWALLLAEFAIVIGVSSGINRLSSPMAALLFLTFAVINGMMFWSIYFTYTFGSIAKTFFITAFTFGAMSIYGFFTTRDLSRWGSILFMALIGLIIASLVNIFMKSGTLDWIVSGIGVLLFVGLTAWDTQQIKRMAVMAPADSIWKLATLGALSLYLDFINMFLYLLRFFGNSRD